MSQMTSLPWGATRVSTTPCSMSAGLPPLLKTKSISGCSLALGSISLARAVMSYFLGAGSLKAGGSSAAVAAEAANRHETSERRMRRGIVLAGLKAGDQVQHTRAGGATAAFWQGQRETANEGSVLIGLLCR